MCCLIRDDDDPEANGDRDMRKWGSNPPRDDYARQRAIDRLEEMAHVALDRAFTIVLWLAVAMGFAAFAITAWWMR